MNDAEVLRIKQQVLSKVDLFLGEQAAYLQRVLQPPLMQLPQEVLAAGPKLSRGEHYQSLPYRMLDYPRLFSPHAIFACRTFFWWGHHLSITLHLRGEYMDRYAVHCLHHLQQAGHCQWKLCVQGDEWEHDATTHPSVCTYLAEPAIAPSAGFSKFSLVFSWGDWSQLSDQLQGGYQQLFVACGFQLPNR